MKMKKIAVYTAVIALAAVRAYPAPPIINSLDKSGTLAWTYGFDSNTGHVARVEMSTAIGSKTWVPLVYDFVSTNLDLPASRLPVYYTAPTNPTRMVQVPTNNLAFYRVAVQTNIPDPSLVLHLTFNQDLSSGIVLDTSGYGNHGLRYGLTNWPSTTIGPDGAQAAEFHVYSAADPTYYGVGDYVAILGTPSLDHLSRATICAWAHYYRSLDGNYANDHTAALLDASWGDTPGSWLLGRIYGDTTGFYIYTSAYNGLSVIGFPDAAPTGDTGGWHYYVVTFDGTKLTGYFDGQPIGTYSQLGLVTELRIGGANANYIAISTWAHNGTPQFADDQYPNCCWMNGAIGDTRIYNRALSASEVLALYNSFDHQAPSLPTGLWTRAAATNQIELRWTPSTDNFYVAGYKVRRNGSLVGTAPGLSYVDSGLNPGTLYAYTVEAFDGAGNLSGQTAAVSTNTLPIGSSVSVIVDDSDGPPQINIQGTWNLSSGPGSWGAGFRGGTQSGGAVSVTYTPVLPGAGSYGVYLWYGGALNGAPSYVWANNVPVDIVHAGVTNTVIVNQQQGYTSWNYLGTYNFTLATNQFVRIRTDGTANGSFGAVAADAVEFTR
jgi:hypothetical protein